MFLIELSASFCVPLWGVLLDFFDGVKDFSSTFCMTMHYTDLRRIGINTNCHIGTLTPPSPRGLLLSMSPVSSGSDVGPILVSPVLVLSLPSCRRWLTILLLIAWRRHPLPEPLIIFRQYDLEQEDDYWEAIARVEAAEIALTDAPSSRPLLKRLLAFVTATLQSIASLISTQSDPAAVATQPDAPTSGDATISNDAVEADIMMPPVSRLYTSIPRVRVEYTTASDYRGSYPLHVIHIPPGAYVLN